MTVWAMLAGAAQDFRRSWRTLVELDLLYKAIAFVVLTPLIGCCSACSSARTGDAAVADVDIALFFFTTRPGARRPDPGQRTRPRGHGARAGAA